MRYGNLAGIMLFVLASTNSRADDSGFYLGVGLGEATRNNGAFHGEAESIREFAGYEFGKYFAAEGGHFDVGTQKDDVGAYRVRISTNSGAFLALLGKYPVSERFSPYVRLGVTSYGFEGTATDGITTTYRFRKSEDPLFGGGLEFKAGDHLRLRADYEKIRAPGIAFDNYSLVAVWKF